MTALYLAYVTALVISAILAGLLAGYVWHRRKAPGGYYFLLLLVCAAEWSLMVSLEMALPDLQAKVLAAQLSYLSAASIGPLWLLFALDYSRWSARITRGRATLLFIVPAVAFAFVSTNAWHGLVWPRVTLVSGALGVVPVYEHGIVFWIHAAYSYALLLAGFGVLAATAARSTGEERHKALAILAGMAIVWAGSLPHALGLTGLLGLDFTPLAMTMTGFLLAWLIFRNRLFELLPVARETLIASLTDGVIVIDDRGTVAEINPAARRLIGAGEASYGKLAGEMPGEWPGLLAAALAGETGKPSEIRIDTPGGSRWLDVRVAPLPLERAGRAGRLIVLRDITELKRSHESLQAEMAERKRAEERIRLSLQEKEVLLKEIHHRVKNNLQIISSLLNLQSGNVNKESAAAFRESQNRIKSMALIHEKLYQSRDLSHIDFAEYVETLTTNLLRSYTSNPGVRISTDIGEISLGIDLAIPCGLIINELISNSLKYAFRDGRPGEIHVGMTQDDNRYVLAVGDDGIGLPQGFDFRESPSLGLQLVNSLVGQIDGTLELDSTEGTRCRITFPTMAGER